MSALFQNLSDGVLIGFTLILLRCIGFIFAAPIFGSTSIPITVRVLFSVTLAVILAPVLNGQAGHDFKYSEQLIMFAAQEVTLGLVIGFVFRFYFFAFSICGELLGISIGLSSAQLFNPAMNTSTNVLEQFNSLLAILIFFSLDGQHLFIKGLYQSFEAVPIYQLGIKFQAFGSFVEMVTATFVMGLKMAAPVLVSVFLANLTMGILGRVVPQINVLMTSLQVTLLIGLGLIFVTLPIFTEEMGNWLQVTSESFFRFLKVI